MKKLKDIFLFIAIPSVFALAAIGCGGGGGEDSPLTSCEDVAGTWNTTEVVDNSDCDEENETKHETYEVTQVGCNLTVTHGSGTYSGSVSGNQVTWSGSFPEEGGTTTLTVNLTFSGNSFKGTGSWTWSDGDERCSGTTKVSGTRSVTPAKCESVAGTWNTTEVVDNSDCDEETETKHETYEVTQDGCSLIVTHSSGTYSGSVDGNQATWSGSFPEEGGTTTLTVNLTFSGDSFKGTGSWTSSDGDESCSGTTDISGIRSNPPSAITPPAAPSDLVATAVSSNSISLSWTDKSANENGFNIERSLSADPSGYSHIATVGRNIHEYNDSSLTPSTEYHYRVRAFNGAGESDYSNTASATTEGLPVTSPAAPSDLKATGVSTSSIVLTWQDNSDNEQSFLIERSSSCSSGFVQIASVGSDIRGYTDTGLNAGQQYCYRVRASNSSYSNYSNCDCDTTEITPTFTLTVNKGGFGTGTITGTGIDCGSDCQETFESGTSVTLTATADSSSSFSGWFGCDSSSGNDCTVTMDEDKLVTATFGHTSNSSVTITGLPSSSSTGNYILQWSFVGFYVPSSWLIQEDSDPTFSSFLPFTSYDTEPPYTHTFTGKPDGTYFYRVKAPGPGNWSLPRSITVSRPTSGVLRIINDTHYFMVDIRLNGNQQVSYPYGILAGQYADFVFTTPGNFSYYLGVGSYDVLERPDVWFQLTGSDIITAGETTTVTFSNPTIGQLLSNFNSSGRDFTGEYYCYSCNILYGMAKFHFGYNGQWTLYDNDVYKSSGNVTLVEWADYSFDVKFRLSPTEPIITIAYPFDMFFYDNGPPDFPRIFYTAQ